MHGPADLPPVTPRRLPLVPLVPLVLLVHVLGTAGAVTAQEPVPPPTGAVGSNPCLDAALGLRCPDLVMRRPYGLRLLRPAKLRRDLLASTNAIVNVGDGPLELRGTRTGPREMASRQVLHAKPGARRLVMEENGRIVFFDTRTRGTYWKFEDAAAFELWSLDADGDRTILVRTGPKIYYCYRDLTKVRSQVTGLRYPGTPAERQYGACSRRGPITRVTLGTSVGWADIYPWRYPQNWIDVTGLRGCFAYVHIADPAEHFVELREDNNSAAVSVRLPWRGAGGSEGCPPVRTGMPPRDVPDPAPPAADEPPPRNPYHPRGR